jgi:hypothetical protein
MYKDELEMLVKFLGEDLLKEENQKKLQELVFSKIKRKEDFQSVNELLKTLESYDLRDFLYSKLLESYFSIFNIIYEKGSLKYGDENYKVTIDNETFDSLIELMDESEINGEILFYLFSDDLKKRVEIIHQLISGRSRKEWNEEELKSFVKNLKPLTTSFLELLIEKGKMKSEEIMATLELKNKKSVSALVSAIIRNAPNDKEKLIFKDNEYICINEKYRNKVFEITNNKK